MYSYTGSDCIKLSFYADEPNNIYKVLSYHNNNWIIVWEFNNFTFNSDNIIRPKGLFYESILLNKAFITFSHDNIGNSYI